MERTGKMSEGYEGNGGEIAETASGEITLRPHQRFAAYLRQRAEMEAPLVAAQLSQDQMDAILSAQTPEELEKAMQLAGLLGLRELEDGTEIEIHGYHVALGTRSEFMNSLGVFAVLDCVDIASGTQFVADTGVERIIAYLRMCEQFDMFPVQVRIKKIQAGRGEMITLLPLRARPVTGTTVD
jgi:hypothetical protein